MIKVIDIGTRPRTRLPEGHVRNVLDASEDGTRVHVAVLEIELGKTYRIPQSNRTQVFYILEGQDANIVHRKSDGTTEHIGRRRSGVYLEPSEEASVTASGTPLTALLVTVPKHTGKSGGATSPMGYFFEEANLRSLVDEKRFRERTFWVNKETGLSGSWDLQLGRMFYAPHAHSPRHVHRAPTSDAITPEHFYLIEKGTGEVRHDRGTIPISSGNLVLIPAGEWHQLVASETGFDYIEFQAPFDFVTTMDHDPLGKNWYIKGTDDGTGKPKLWVQS